MGTLVICKFLFFLTIYSKSNARTAWSQGSPQGYNHQAFLDILATLMVPGGHKYSFLVDAESYLWGVWGAPFTTAFVLKMNSQLSGDEIIQRVSSLTRSLAKAPGSREVGYNQNPEFDEGEEFVIVGGWESAQVDDTWTDTKIA
jgi:hypothetical protein